METYPYYVVNIAVAPMRREADQRSEQVSQARLGEVLKYLSEDEGWLKLKLQIDGYEGYVSPGMVVGFTNEQIEKWMKHKFFIFGERTADILDSPYEGGRPVRSAVMAVKLPILERKGEWVNLLLPDGETGWTRSRSFHHPKQGGREGIADTARMFSGAPYLWGGRGSGGFDCSGFIQTVFELNGINLPRDTSQQIKVGREIGRDWTQALPGDLVFFGNESGKVNHVGIYLGDGRVIHSSGIVHVSSLDPEDKLHSEELLRRFLHVRSIEEFLRD